MTEYVKFTEMLLMYEKLLHPDIFNPLLKQAHKVKEEAIKEAYKEAKISDDALWIEKKIIELKERHSRMNGDEIIDRFYMKCFYKDLVKKFLPSEK